MLLCNIYATMSESHSSHRNEHSSIFSQIKLMLIDEVHLPSFPGDMLSYSRCIS